MFFHFNVLSFNSLIHILQLINYIYFTSYWVMILLWLNKWKQIMNLQSRVWMRLEYYSKCIIQSEKEGKMVAQAAKTLSQKEVEKVVAERNLAMLLYGDMMILSRNHHVTTVHHTKNQFSNRTRFLHYNRVLCTNVW